MKQKISSNLQDINKTSKEIMMSEKQELDQDENKIDYQCQLTMLGVKKETKESSFDIGLKEAKGGDARAQYHLGFSYYNGEGVTQDKKEAVKWYRLAAEQGHALAQYNLGVSYDNGEGVTQDKEEAAKWYHLAAEQGDAWAQNNLGLLYNNKRI